LLTAGTSSAQRALAATTMGESSAQENFEHFKITDNILRMLFLDPATPKTRVDWEAFARLFVGSIRGAIGAVIDDATR
jgi:hypothetical protein